MHKSNYRGASPPLLKHGLHAIDATPGSLMICAQVCNGSLVEKKELLGALKKDPAFGKEGPFAKQAKLAMQFGSFQHDYAAEVGLGAFDDVLPFSQVQILEESKTYVQKNICGGDLEITIIDLDASADAPGPEKKRANASPGKVALHVYAAEA